MFTLKMQLNIRSWSHYREYWAGFLARYTEKPLLHRKVMKMLNPVWVSTWKLVTCRWGDRIRNKVLLENMTVCTQSHSKNCLRNSGLTVPISHTRYSLKDSLLLFGSWVTAVSTFTLFKNLYFSLFWEQLSPTLHHCFQLAYFPSTLSWYPCFSNSTSLQNTL